MTSEGLGRCLKETLQTNAAEICSFTFMGAQRRTLNGAMCFKFDYFTWFYLKLELPNLHVLFPHFSIVLGKLYIKPPTVIIELLDLTQREIFDGRGW